MTYILTYEEIMYKLFYHVYGWSIFYFVRANYPSVWKTVRFYLVGFTINFIFFVSQDFGVFAPGRLQKDDVPINWQMGFQDPASHYMNCLVELHTEIWVYLFFVLGLVFSVLISITGWNLPRFVFFVYFYFLTDREKVLFWKNRLPEGAGLDDVVRITLPSFIQHNSLLECIWTVGPILIIGLIAAPSFSLLYENAVSKDFVATLHVTGAQWYWSYEIPYGPGNAAACWDGILCEDVWPGMFRLLDTDTKVVLPANVNLRLEITSSDVLHSFCVPSLGLKMDACPGRSNQVGLYAWRCGFYYGQCSEICGVRHAFMPIAVQVVRDLDCWKDWVYSIK